MQPCYNMLLVLVRCCLVHGSNYKFCCNNNTFHFDELRNYSDEANKIEKHVHKQQYYIH